MFKPQHLLTASVLCLALAAAGCGERDAATDPAADVTAAEDRPADPATTALGVADGEVTTATEFARRAALSNMFEIQASQYAIERNVEPRVREYAQMMITDHQAAAQQMQTTLQGAGVTVAMPTELTQEWEEWMQDLRGLTAPDQVAANYIDKMVTSHERAVAMFERYAQAGDNPQLQQLAQQMLPTLRTHLERARAMDTADTATTTPAGDGLPGSQVPQ